MQWIYALTYTVEIIERYERVSGFWWEVIEPLPIFELKLVQACIGHL